MLKSFDKNSALEEIIKELNEHSGVIIENLVDTALIDKVNNEFRPHFDEIGEAEQSDFNGFNTLRLNSILEISRTAAELIAHPVIIDVADAALKPYCSNYRIGSSTAIEIHPGEKAQLLHHDDEIYPFRLPGVEYQLAALWAMDDFTALNGATRVIPGSHKREDLSDVADKGVVQAVMPKGSVLLYFGTTVHGGGENRSDKPRSALVTTYSLGWLRQEENHYMSIPKDIADSYPERIRQLMGFASYSEILGTYPNSRVAKKIS